MSTEIHGGLALIAAPSAVDRIPLGTAPNAGGYSLRGSFVWKGGNDWFEASGPNPAIRVIPENSTQFGGIEVYTGGQHEMSLLAKGATGEVNLSCGRSVGWGGHLKIIIDTVECARFTNAGHFGVGVTPAVRLHAKSNAEIARLETTTARGSGSLYQTYYDPSGRKGYIGYGTSNDDLHLINELGGALGLGTAAIFRWQVTSGGNFQPIADNGYNLAAAGARIANSYFAVSPTVTSDEREKTWRGAPTEAELRAAKRMIAELGFYQWNDAVAEKGSDGARYHFGARAQRVWQIMAEEKLVDPIKKNGKPGATPYAFLCWDEWDEQREPEMKDVEIPATLDADGNEDAPARTERQPTGKEIVTLKAGNRYGLRVDQFTLFLVAAQEARLAALEAALAG